MDLDAIKALNGSYLARSEVDRQAALARLGHPSPDELVELGLEGLEDPDRNVRGQMVRLLSMQSGARAAEGMRRALLDPARRVRKLAAKLSWRFADDEGVRGRLREIIDDEDEIPKVRAAAFHALASGGFLTSLVRSADEARHWLDDVRDPERYRRNALELLISMDELSDDARELLRYVGETGTKEEAVAATRALSGFRVANLGSYADPAERRRVARTCQPYRGRVFFWVPRRRA